MSDQPVIFPDVEGLLVAHLNGLLAVPVSTQIPNPRPTSFVRVMRTGGPRDGLVVDQAQLTIEAWAASSVAASDLARTVRARLGALTGRRIGTVQIQRVRELGGPASDPDPASGSPRYSWTVQIPVRGAVLA